MTRLFVSEDLSSSTSFVPSSSDMHYLQSVLRMRPGERFVVVDSLGIENECEFLADMAVSIVGRKPCSSEPPASVTLLQSVSKGERMDLTIQKSVELGVSRIVPVLSSRCIAKVSGDSKISRWQKIALEAARQSGRGIVPEVSAPVKFSAAVDMIPTFDLVLFPWEEAEGVTIRDVLRSGSFQNIGVFIGPEGGFSEDEERLAASRGARVVTLGKRILRTETAGPAVLAMVLYETEL